MIQVKLEVAAGYCRKSPSPERKRRHGGNTTEKSINEQKDSVQKLAAKHGCHIPDHLWFIDEAWQGDDEERPDFNRLFSEYIQDPNCPFQKLFTYEQGRFSRADKDTAAYYYLQLRENDIALISCLEGVIVDPDSQDDLGQGICRDVVQYGKHKFLKDLAFAVARSSAISLKQGIVGGPVPYGCKRREDGRVEAGDPVEVSVVQWIFEAFLSGLAIWAIARRLNQDRVLSPAAGKTWRGKPCSGKWSGNAIKFILRNPVYCGQRKVLREHTGNHCHIQDSEVVPVHRRNRGKRTKGENGGILPEQPGFVGDPIVSVDDWERSQEILDARVVEHPQERSLPLVGLLRCCLCGLPMNTNRDNRSGREYYRCAGLKGRLRPGEKPAHAEYVLPAKTAWTAVIDKLMNHVLHPKHIDQMVVELRKELRKESKSSSQVLSSLEKSEKSTREMLDKVRRNMLYADNPEAVSEFSAEVARLREELTKIQAGISSAKSLSGASEVGIDRIVSDVFTHLHEVRKNLENQSDEDVAAAIHQMLTKIVVTVGDAPPRRPRPILGVDLQFVGDGDFRRTTCNSSQIPKWYAERILGSFCRRREFRETLNPTPHLSRTIF